MFDPKQDNLSSSSSPNSSSSPSTLYPQLNSIHSPPVNLLNSSSPSSSSIPPTLPSYPPPFNPHHPISPQTPPLFSPFLSQSHSPSSHLIATNMADPHYQDSTTSTPTRFDYPTPSPISNLFSQYSPPVQHPHHPYPYPASASDSSDQLKPPPHSSLSPSHQHPPFLNSFIHHKHNLSSSSLADSHDQVISRQPEELHKNQKLSALSIKDRKTASKSPKRKPPPKSFYRHLVLIGLAALFLIASAVVIILVMHIKNNSNHLTNGTADDSNDIISQSGLGSARNISSDGLDPFNRTSPNTNNGLLPDNGRRGGPNGYDSLIVFGASYCDNAHARSYNLRYSLKPPPYYKGRWTNGYVWDEYLSAIIGPGGGHTMLVNYAFGGATVDNALNEAPVPDLEQQVNAFLSDLKARSPGAGPSEGKSLIAIWIGINSVTKIWNYVLKQQVQARSQVEVQETIAQAQVNVNSTVDQIFNVVANLIHTNAFKNTLPDLMILTIPPVQLLLVNIRAAKGNMGALRTLETLNEMFNNRFNTQFNLLQDNLAQQQKQSVLSTDNNDNLQRLFTLDIQNIWRKFMNDPSTSNLTVVDQPCLTKLGVCNQAQSYLFWDTLHPTTHIHKQLALMMSDEISR